MTTVVKDTGHKVVISPGAKGSISEHLATAWLLRHGYDVFRNVSPHGRADLLAVDWDKDETIRVDVKSKGFTLDGTGARVNSAKTRERANEGFDIRYLIVDDVGGCEWYVEKPEAPANDNFAGAEWWQCPVTLQRFTVPGIDMSMRSWAFFCHWVLKYHSDLMHPIAESFVQDIASRGVGRGSSRFVKIEPREFKALENLRRQVYEGLSLRGAIMPSVVAA